MSHRSPRLITYLILITLLVGSLKAQVYLDPNAPLEVRVVDLLSRMTLEEKVGQMTQADHAAVSNLQDVQSYYLGSILSGGGSDPSAGNDAVHWADLYDTFQNQALQTRLQIPLIYGIDAVHGHSNVTGATIFPHNIGLGSTRNPELMEQIGRVTAIEIAATGIDWTFAPCIAVPRDERWGRTYEGFGETPALAELLGSAAIRGLQNDSLNSPTSIVACAKHYIGDGGTQYGDDQGNTIISEAELRALHLPGYIEAIENDVKTIMATYNSWNGEKVHGHSYLLNDVLKTELGFQGFVVSDWAAIDQLPGDYSSDIATSINAGIDMVMVPNNYPEFFNSLISLVDANVVPLSRINDAVERILRVKFELGLFENPLTDRSLLPLVGSEDHRTVARQAVRESQVLLKKNDGILPLSNQGIKVLVAGEHANNIGLQCGGWTIQWGGASGPITPGTTILQGLQEVAPNVEFVYDADGNFTDDDADYIIAVIGEQPYAEGGGDVSDLTVRDSQIRLVRQLKQKGLPVITLLISGRPMLIQHVLHNSDAIIASWLPGTEGDGIAELLFGDFAPTGLLPMTWPRSMAQIPINVGDVNYDPLFAYGFGITDLGNSPTGSDPLLQSAMLIEGGAHIELSFNKSMDHPGNSNAEFLVMKNQTVPVAVTGFALSPLGDNILDIVLEGPCLDTDELSISYITGNLLAEDGGTLAGFAAEPVINLLPYVVGTHDLPGRIQAENYTSMSGIQTEETSDVGGGINVGWIDSGDWMEYDCLVETAGNYDMVFRIAAQQSPGLIRFFRDDAELFSLAIPVTGGWQSWDSTSEQVTLPLGACRIKILAETGGFNLNWFEGILAAGTDDSPIARFQLEQNFPNPFNPITTITYHLPTRSDMRLDVYDLRGNLVSTLEGKKQDEGTHHVAWDGLDQAGHPLSAGVYLCHLTAGSFSETIKMVLLR